jgi:hypothetical protein
MRISVATMKNALRRSTRNDAAPSNTTVANRSRGGRFFANGVSATAIAAANHGIHAATGVVKSGCHSTIGRDIRTVSARNRHMRNPYGFTNVARALKTATRTASPLEDLLRPTCATVQMERIAAPTIHPP